jgi:hypothetical protein
VAVRKEVRRVATGHDVDGRAVIASDAMVAPVQARLLGPVEIFMLWGADKPPVFPDNGSHPEVDVWFPPPHAFRLAEITIPPDSSQPDILTDPAELNAAIAELETVLPGFTKSMEAGPPGRHVTSTIDLQYVLEGEVVCELDDGLEVRLKAGDYFIQNGTVHQWHNYTDSTARMLMFMLGVEHRDLPG